ncbi:hypothetical protein D9M71_705480 [compost metagenome]
MQHNVAIRYSTFGHQIAEAMSALLDAPTSYRSVAIGIAVAGKLQASAFAQAHAIREHGFPVHFSLFCHYRANPILMEVTGLMIG